VKKKKNITKKKKPKRTQFFLGIDIGKWDDNVERRGDRWGGVGGVKGT